MQTQKLTAAAADEAETDDEALKSFSFRLTARNCVVYPINSDWGIAEFS